MRCLVLNFFFSLVSAATPAAPTIGTVVPGAGTLTVSFTPSPATGVAQTYHAVSTPDALTASSTASPISISGATPGRSYTVVVYASNFVGNSANSAASSSVTIRTNFDNGRACF